MSPTPAERRAAAAARVARGTERPDPAHHRPAQVKTTIRSTVDLPVPRHRQLDVLAAEYADARGQATVSRQAMLATLVELALAEDELGQAVRAALLARLPAPER